MKIKLVSKVAKLRKKIGLTQKQLAVLVGVTSNTIQNWEKEDGLNQLEKYIKLSILLGCNPNELFEYTYIETPSKNPKSQELSLEELERIRMQWDLEIKRLVQDEKTSIVSCSDWLNAKKYNLTIREAQIWYLKCAEYPYKEIASTLKISINTVKKHLKNITIKIKD